MKVTMHEAVSNLSDLGEKAWKGERVVITKAGKPYLDLVPHKVQLSPRKPGRFKREIEFHIEFEEVNAEITSSFDDDE
ncbi:type II toxin-antitoxin system Phd/YefM family antitoxin [Pseudovibrio brasiliensis]|uniref:Type II toxin-antitoxin system prevent-host-death family antitoxin n=1 Tax=Pseudovibrio brasiliensis TaxID=1898042 RepID=A0ABX8AIK1_9HYPH|nr:antitoxin [Pseudovibrio brasiliensis]QUS54899.1 type II toxin-antitoxin system prevent-host-death family antitoxin [Pseudovibrio brasiliensis]